MKVFGHFLGYITSMYMQSLLYFKFMLVYETTTTYEDFCSFYLAYDLWFISAFITATLLL